MNLNNYAVSLNDLVRTHLGSSVRLQSDRPAYGGDINDSRIYQLSDGTCIFVKQNQPAGLGMFLEEEKGLQAIRETNTISVPSVLGAGTDPAGFSFLAMEYIAPARQSRHFWEQFGRNLADMHRSDTASQAGSGAFGFVSSNYIGRTEQDNTPEESWITFFRNRRLLPQYRMALSCFRKEDRKAIEYLLDHLDRYLTEPAFPSLLHGDLWGGNFITGPDGLAWVIDPAVYVGHAEADLAMTELFGGFERRFYDAYYESFPQDPGYKDRRDLYNLYHLLNHLNMFGGGYQTSVLRIIRHYV